MESYRFPTLHVLIPSPIRCRVGDNKFILKSEISFVFIELEGRSQSKDQMFTASTSKQGVLS